MDQDGRPAPVRIYAMVASAGGLSCLLAAAFPADAAAPATLLGVLGAITLSLAVIVWWIGERMTPWGLQVLGVIATVQISLAVHGAATGLGMIVTACAYLWVCVFVGFFFSQRAARAQMAFIAAAFGLALLTSDNHVPVNAYAFITISLVTAGETLGRQSARLRHEAHTDPLTGVLNRNGLARAAERTFSLADRTGIPLTAALIDLDHFKQINDLEGHAAGDRLLVELTRRWADELEPSDLLARLGGDEFLVVLVGSDKEESVRAFERLRFVSPAEWSAGVVKREHGEDLSACLTAADAALYEAKRTRGAHRGALLPPPPERPRAVAETL